MNLFQRWLGCLIVVAMFAGCGGRGQATVNGTVVLDGQPVPSGNVTFVIQDDTKLVREGAVITNGKFTTKLAPGKYKLELNGQKVTGTRVQKDFDGKEETLTLTGEMFPPQFNTKSTLSEDIKPGPNDVKLDLKSMP